jgi:septum formation protein
MLILASKSPRRKELLSKLGVPFFVAQSNADELTDNLPSDILVKENALLKAKDILSNYPNDIILGADTIVTIDNLILGKPKSLEDAKATLRLLSGREHFVYTGVAIVGKEINISYVVSTKVVFKKLTPNIIDEYLEKVHVLDKAGSYAIQEHGNMIIESIEGELENVIGLPLIKLKEYLKQFFPTLLQ